MQVALVWDADAPPWSVSAHRGRCTGVGDVAGPPVSVP